MCISASHPPVSNTWGEVFFADICGRVHAGEKTEVFVSYNRFDITDEKRKNRASYLIHLLWIIITKHTHHATHHTPHTDNIPYHHKIQTLFPWALQSQTCFPADHSSIPESRPSPSWFHPTTPSHHSEWLAPMFPPQNGKLMNSLHSSAVSWAGRSSGSALAISQAEACVKFHPHLKMNSFYTSTKLDK